MKKATILLFAAAATAGTLFTSCNKDYNCVCRLNGTETNSYSVRAKTQNEAEDKCNERQTALGTTYQCAIE